MATKRIICGLCLSVVFILVASISGAATKSHQHQANSLLLRRARRDAPNDEEGEHRIREAPATNQPVYLSKSVELRVAEGQNVTFPCDVKDLEPYIVLWRRRNRNQTASTNDIIFAGKHNILRNDRFTLTGPKSTSLSIRSVELSDTGIYYCQVSSTPPMELNHKLVVMAIKIDAKPASGVEAVKRGETVMLECTAHGSPKPTVTWSRLDMNSEELKKVPVPTALLTEKMIDAGTVASTLTIKTANSSDAGQYVCEAVNQDGMLNMTYQVQVSWNAGINVTPCQSLLMSMLVLVGYVLVC